MDCSLPAPLSMGFSRQEYWSGLPCPPPGDLPNPGIKPASFMSPALSYGFFTTSANLGSPLTLSNPLIRFFYQQIQLLNQNSLIGIITYIQLSFLESNFRRPSQIRLRNGIDFDFLPVGEMEFHWLLYSPFTIISLTVHLREPNGYSIVFYRNIFPLGSQLLSEKSQIGFASPLG